MYNLEFDSAGHKYKLNDRPIVSVSAVVSMINGNTYKDVPADILTRAADFGTDVHKMIELYNVTSIIKYTEDIKKNHCLLEWVKLSKKIKIFENETMVHFKDLFAGTFDSLGVYDGALTLVDYKTTNRFLTENVTLQLNLYRIAFEWKTGQKIKEMAGVWLPKHLPGKIIFVERMDDDVLIEKVLKALDENT